MQRCNENVHFLTLFCHLILVIFTLTSWYIFLVFQIIFIILTANLCSLVKWCTSDAFKRYNIVILFLVTFVSSQVDGQTLLLGETVHLWCLDSNRKLIQMFFIFRFMLIIWRPSSAPWWNGAPLMPLIQTTNLFPCSGTSTNCSIKTFQISVWWQCEVWKQDKYKTYSF